MQRHGTKQRNIYTTLIEKTKLGMQGDGNLEKKHLYLTTEIKVKCAVHFPAQLHVHGLHTVFSPPLFW